MSQPRRHHLLPKHYLKGFTDTGSDDGFVQVFDYQRAKSYRRRPGEIGHERDFYRIDEPGYDSFTVEKDLADLETALAPPLARVLQTGRFQNGYHLGEVLSLVALIHVRGRWGRERIVQSSQETMRQKLAAEVVTPEQWAKMKGAHIRDGLDPASIPSLEHAQEMAKKGWRPPVSKVVQAGFLSEIQRGCFEVLARHSWALAKADLGNGGFICSETPLAWGTDPSVVSNLSDPSTLVTFPLSKQYALFTRQDGKHATFEAVDEMVASINARTHAKAMGTIYCCGPDYLIDDPNGISRGRDLFRFLTKGGSEGVIRPPSP